MGTLYTLAYPELADGDRSFIDQFRHQHDLPYRDVVDPHFTLVFGCSSIETDVYSRHVEAVAEQSQAIDFRCRYAMLGVDDVDDTSYVFLVPDEGYSGLSLLHDRLYEGILSPHLRLEFPFIPHITIGTLLDRPRAKSLCDELNRAGVSIFGRVGSVTVGELDGGKVRDLVSYPLGSQ